jgi:hypothetical protein
VARGDLPIKKDLLFTVCGLAGLGYMMVTGKVNIIMVLVCMFISGAPGLQGFISLLRSLTRDANRSDDDAPTTSSGSPSPSSSLPPSSLRPLPTGDKNGTATAVGTDVVGT